MKERPAPYPRSPKPSFFPRRLLFGYYPKVGAPYFLESERKKEEEGRETEIGNNGALGSGVQARGSHHHIRTSAPSRPAARATAGPMMFWLRLAAAVGTGDGGGAGMLLLTGTGGAVTEVGMMTVVGGSGLDL